VSNNINLGVKHLILLFDLYLIYDIIVSKGRDTMSKQNRKSKTWVEVFQSERKTFPQGYCVTRVREDKRRKSPKHKGRELDE